jgi:hypothetical protein
MVLLAASDWGIPPWEVTGEEPDNAVRLKWYFTWREAFRVGGVRWGNRIKGLTFE